MDDSNGNDIPTRYRRLLRLLDEFQPDLIGTQETTLKWNNYLKSMENGYGIFTGDSRDGAGQESGEWGTILYNEDRFELLDGGTFWLSATPDTVSQVEGAICRRICTWVKLRDERTDNIILFVNTHLDHSNDEIRGEQAKCLMSHLQTSFGDELNELVVYMTGDFNCTSKSLPYAYMTQYLSDAHIAAAVDGSTVSVTYHGYNDNGSGKEIDFCFANSKSTALRYEIIEDKYAAEDSDAPGFVSDHYGVLATFQIK